MCGLIGLLDFTKDTSNLKDIVIDMNETLSKRGPDEEGFYYENNVCLAHRRLVVVDPDGGKQPMSFQYNDNIYTIIYNGQLYNTNTLMEELKDNGFIFNNHSDTEVLLKSFIHWGYDVIKKINGIYAFAIWDKNKKELFFARDHFGVKPFYYSQIDTTFIFASEIKSLLKFPGLRPKLDSQGISELLGLGPAHTPGIGIFKNINELKPAHYGIYNKNGLFLQKYWELVSKPHTDSLGKTCEKVRDLLENSIKSQLVSDVPLCTFLSGGLDSSIITLYASNYCKENNLHPLETYSVDYLDNDKNFVANDFQPDSDKFFIDLLIKKLDINHHNVILDTPELADNLENAMLARDFPGMADVDSSLLLFCKNVKKNATVALTGECSDEIFGGYPWFFRDDSLNSGTFPWSIALTQRQLLLNSEISKHCNIKEYVNYRYFESLSKVEILETDSEETAEKRKISYLTLNWFMQTLLERSDRMAMYNGVELRVPFCEYKLAEYVWNIPWELKSLNGREKGLLRYVMKDYLPAQIIDRKKSPYPKTCNPTYLEKVKKMLTLIINNSESPINKILNRDYIIEIIKTDGKSFTRPWFGQLMTGPQLIAYLVQLNMWLEHYNPEIIL